MISTYLNITSDYFGLELDLGDYNQWIFKNDTIFELDKMIFYQEIKKIANSERNSSTFEIRYLVNGVYKWHRLNLSAIKNEFGKVIKGICTVAPIEEELMNKFRYDIELAKLSQFNNNYIAYVLIDLDDFEILSANSFILKTENMYLDKNVDLYLEKLKSKVLNGNDYQKLCEFLSLENLNKDEQDKPSFKYRRVGNDNFQFWVESRINYLTDPYNNHRLCVVETFDVNQIVEEQRLLKSLVKEENEVVYMADLQTEQVVVFAKDGNKLDIKAGMQVITFSEYDFQYFEKMKIFKYTNPKVKLKSISENFKELHVNSTYNFLFETLEDSPKYIFRVNMILDENQMLLIYIDDVTSIIENERKVSENLEIAIQEAKSANDSKDEFFSRMSHDMRTPMTAILAMADFALEEVQVLSVKEYITQIKTSSNHLLALLNDVLDLQKSEKIKLSSNPQVHDGETFMISTAKMIEVKAKEKDINFSYNINLIPSFRYLVFDDIRVRQLLLNVLNNAIKYTPNCGDVTWDVEFYKKDNVLFMKNIISDNGIGMSEDFQKIMFEQFSREERDCSSNEPGTGLGLSIVMSLIEYWGGSIEFDSELDKGTTFTINFSMPIANSQQIAEYITLEKEMIPNFSYNNKRVLIVEDVSINARIIGRLLNEKDITSSWVNNGLKAINAVKNGNYDLVIMDIKMPVMDGLEATKRIRTFNNEIPIVGLSANAYIADVLIAKECGMNDYLSKPIDKKLFFETLGKVLKR